MRARRRFFWKLFLGNAALLLVVVGTCVWLILDAFDRFYAEDVGNHLTTLAEAVRHQVQDGFDADHAQALDRLAKEAGASGGGRVRFTFVLTDGKVLGDSEADPQRMESHADRPEIQQALRGGGGASTRWSNTVSREMKYVAVRVGPAEAPRGVVRVSMGLLGIVEREHAARRLFWTIALIVLGAAAMLALGLARLWSEPIARITATARSLSHGDLSARAEVGSSDELGGLARSLNQMRDHLAGQLDTIDHQRRTLEHLLSQLHEGVVAARPDGRIVLINPAAVRLLALREAIPECSRSCNGPTVEALVQQQELREMLMPRHDGSGLLPGGPAAEPSTPAGEAAAVLERRLTLERASQSVTLLARASAIVLPADGDARGGVGTGSMSEDPAAQCAGRLLVLTDITELTHTLQVKTDFVMNASHELRTPLAAIRAAVETLMGMDLSLEDPSAKNIVRMIDRQSHRLEAMVTDLLHLSRIESSSARFPPKRLQVGQVLSDLHERFAARAAAKNLHYEASTPADDEIVIVSRTLLDLLLDNLVDNAIKFTPEGGRVIIRAWSRERAFHFRVEDTGCGIAEEERDRVFERFYQVERSRTGSTRGTGLGLSIVRHAVNAMQGEIHLASELGRGTCMTVRIPQPGADPKADGE